MGLHGISKVSFLVLLSDKRRPEEDIQALEAKNKITRDMVGGVKYFFKCFLYCGLQILLCFVILSSSETIKSREIFISNKKTAVI